MTLIKRLFYQAASVVPMTGLKRLSALKLLLPYHHLISDERVRHVCHLYSYKTPAQFRSDLDYLLAHFEPLHPQELIRSLREGNGPDPRKNSFLLSFDDGFRETYDLVRPILKEKGLSAIFFLNPAYIDNRELCFRNKLSLIIDALRVCKYINVLYYVKVFKRKCVI